MRNILDDVLIGALFFLSGLMPVLAQTVIPVGTSMLLPAGGVNLACTNLDVQGSVVVGSSHIDQVNTIGITPTGVLNGGQGTINVGGDWNNTGSFIPGTGTVIFGDICGISGGQLIGNTSFNNLTFTSATGKPFTVPAGSHITVTGHLLLQGGPGNPLQLTSSSGAIAYILLGPNATVTYSNTQPLLNVQIGTSVNPTSIPTLNEYGLLLLSLLLAATAAMKKSLPFWEFEKPESKTDH